MSELSEATEIYFNPLAEETSTLSKVRAKTNLTMASWLGNRLVQRSFYSVFINDISKEISISKLLMVPIVGLIIYFMNYVLLKTKWSCTNLH